jgi:hypothetical protein
MVTLSYFLEICVGRVDFVVPNFGFPFRRGGGGGGVSSYWESTEPHRNSKLNYDILYLLFALSFITINHII